MEYMTIKEASEKWNIVVRRINTLCIEGAHKLGNMWVIPENTEKLKDERVKSGRYVKK